MMLITDAPTFVVRDALALVPGVTIEDTAWDGIDAPSWASTLITAFQSDALALGLARLGAFRFDTWRPRPATADPTYAMAAANLERRPTSGGSAPAAAWAR